MAENYRVDFEKSRAALQSILLRSLPEDGDFPTPVCGFMLHRHSRGHAPKANFYDPVIIVVVQGKKWVRIGMEDIQYGEQTCFIAGINMPVSSCVLEASEDKPFLSMSLELDKSLLAGLAAKVPPPAEDRIQSSAGAAVQEVSPELLDAFLRLLELLESPGQAEVLGDLIRQEIYYRLLTSPFGYHLRMLSTLGSQSHQINKAIMWLRENYRESLHVEKLAGRLNMATSTFHKYFKEITTLSPLQYQKRLRLSEAQRLMLSGDYDVTQAAFAVGYESATQFNREYKRLYGESPRKDIMKMKNVTESRSLRMRY
ncbi:AraC family transcriptional regulator [Desulfovibrio sp. PG-178-WT-4]|uniref:AraC family transcriptional regulator n=2 Tax=Desulfovibrio TaxID=872 RepID=A0A6L5XJQ2_9BACT|nr:AraC family transcriptional regulator [Desulfovibrio porci]MDY3809786.1 AraC family transcriptional regulator [Desulfovibrio porci]MSS27440.1 AraC family transcriptional regulator [Desulfovibrio porci]